MSVCIDRFQNYLLSGNLQEKHILAAMTAENLHLNKVKVERARVFTQVALQVGKAERKRLVSRKSTGRKHHFKTKNAPLRWRLEGNSALQTRGIKQLLLHCS